MLLSVRSFGQFLLLFSLVSTIVGCSPLTNKAKSTTNTANLSLDEKPEILDIPASVTWDGEQTLGGNWISHPNVDSPDRVLIKNISNGKSIVGAIFQQTKKMETENAVISSDAARALGISKNNQTKVQIIAVRVAEGTSQTSKIASSGTANNAVIETKLSKPFIQVGIFGVQNNANKTKDRMVRLDLPVNVFDFQIKGKPYWRVVAGPAETSDSRKNMLKLIRSAGFKDAYFVSN